MNRIRLLWDAVIYWRDHRATDHSAALTFYALASLTSLLVLLLSVAGLFFNPERISRFLVSPVAVAIGEENSAFVRDLVDNYYHPEASVTAGAISLLIMLNTGSSLFLQLGESLNLFLGVKTAPMELTPERRILRIIGIRLKAIAYVVGAEALILAGLLAATVLQLAEERLGGLIDLPFSAYSWGSRLLSVALIVVILSLVYRLLPNRPLSWRAAWSGGLVGSLLILLLQSLMSWYLARAGVGSAFGAAGSLVAFLYWVYYSIQALFLGAAFGMIVDSKTAPPAEKSDQGSSSRSTGAAR